MNEEEALKKQREAEEEKQRQLNQSANGAVILKKSIKKESLTPEEIGRAQVKAIRNN